MAERVIDVKVAAGNIPAPKVEEFEKVLETRAEKKARLATVLDRGMVGDRLSVVLPDDKYGEWVPNDKVEIHRFEAMGFEVDRKYARSRALHSDGSDGTSVIGDVIFMTCEKETKEIIEEIKRENYDRVNAPKKSKEEIDFENQTKNSATPAVINSSTSSVNENEIRSAVLQG